MRSLAFFVANQVRVQAERDRPDPRRTQPAKSSPEPRAQQRSEAGSERERVLPRLALWLGLAPGDK